MLVMKLLLVFVFTAKETYLLYICCTDKIKKASTSLLKPLYSKYELKTLWCCN